MSVVPGVSYASLPHTHNLCNAICAMRNDATSLLARARWLMRGASEAHPSPAASVCPTARISTIVEASLDHEISSPQGSDQILRLGLALLNHQTRIALQSCASPLPAAYSVSQCPPAASVAIREPCAATLPSR
jgi:hypothetical protein